LTKVLLNAVAVEFKFETNPVVIINPPTANASQLKIKNPAIKNKHPINVQIITDNFEEEANTLFT